MTETTDTTPAPTEGFIIDSTQKADWAIGLLADLEAKEARIKAQYAAMMRQIETDKNAWHGRFDAALENFAREEMERTKSKRKSLTLFNGTLGFRAVPARLVIENEADALQTARAVCPGAIIEVPATEKLDKKTLGDYAKGLLETTGEVLTGFTVTEAREAFSVKVPTAGGDTTE